MVNFLRDRGSTAEDKRREALGAYLDNALTAAERKRFEGQLARDAGLRAELEQMQALKLQMRAMPRRRVPRSFALDPALYGRPKAQPMMQLYPVLRGATALAAFLLIFTLALGVFRGQFAGGELAAPEAAEISMSDAVVEESAPAEEIAPLVAATAPTEQDRAMSTEAPEMEAAEAEAPTELAFQEAITEAVTAETMPPAQGTPAAGSAPDITGVPDLELQIEATETAAEPTVEAAAEAMETVEEEAESAAADSTANVPAPVAEASEPAGGDSTASLLRPIQIGLGVVFLLLFILWLVARRRVRSFS